MPRENWGLGTGVKYANSLANTVPLSNIQSYASGSGVCPSIAPTKLWQAQLAGRVKILDLQSSKQLYNASLGLPRLLLVLISPARVAELPLVCTAPEHGQTGPSQGSVPELCFLVHSHGCQNWCWFVSSSQLHTFLWCAHILPYLNRSKQQQIHQISVLYGHHIPLCKACTSALAKPTLSLSIKSYFEFLYHKS